MRQDRILNTCIALLLTIASLATVANPPNPGPSEDRLSAMSRLHHWTGLWQGGG